MNVGNFNANFKAVNSLNENGALRGKERLPVNENPPKFDKQDYIVIEHRVDDKGKQTVEKRIIEDDELTGQIEEWYDANGEMYRSKDSIHKIMK